MVKNGLNTTETESIVVVKLNVFTLSSTYAMFAIMIMFSF